MNDQEKAKWLIAHTLSDEQVRQLIENKFRRAVEHLEASKTVKELILAE